MQALAQSDATQPDLIADPDSARCQKPLVLEIKGLIVPSHKNNKMVIANAPNGKPLKRPLLITKPEYQKAMAKIVDSFALQLLSDYQTEGGATQTGCSLASWIACNVPADDCWTVIPQIEVRAELVESGSEGAVVVIERIN